MRYVAANGKQIRGCPVASGNNVRPNSQLELNGKLTDDYGWTNMIPRLLYSIYADNSIANFLKDISVLVDRVLEPTPKIS